MRSISSSEFTLGRIWRDESVARGYHYITCGGGSISIIDNQRSKLSCCGLFVVIQCHHWKTNFEQLKGSNIYLPPIGQIPTDYRIGQVQGDQLEVRESISYRRLYRFGQRYNIFRIPINTGVPFRVYRYFLYL